MALNVVEQLVLIEQGFTNLTKPLEDVIYQQALNTAGVFLSSEKDTSPGGTDDPLATSYLEKMKRVFQQVQLKQTRIISTLIPNVVARIGTTVAQDLGTVQNATENQVLGFLNNNMLAILEQYALVTVDEKAAYDVL